jgi:hypothetical protein
LAALERLVIEEPHRVPQMLGYPELELLRGEPQLAGIRQRFRLP